MSLQITAAIKWVANNSTLATFPFKWNNKLGCYVCDVDLNNANVPDMSQVRVDITMYSPDLNITQTYDKDTIYAFNTDSSFIYDRTQKDVNKVKELTQKWYTESGLTDEEKALWATNMKGTLNPEDITRIQTSANNVLGWYIQKYDSFNSSEPYYIASLSFYRLIIPLASSNEFMYKAGFESMLTQLNKLFTWLNSQPYTDMPVYLRQLISKLGRYLNYTFSGTIPNSILTYKNFKAWNDLELLLHVLFLTVISYNRNISKRMATDYIWHGVIAELVDYEYAGESTFAGSRFI